jgi:hypothetical protein
MILAAPQETLREAEIEPKTAALADWATRFPFLWIFFVSVIPIFYYIFYAEIF